MEINWDTFRTANRDSRGIQFRFEDLCRQLFEHEFLAGNHHTYLHCNPNNPGLEADPIYDGNSNKKIGFQVKFFENRVNYVQIEHSAEEIIAHYAGRVDAVYLYSNKPLSSKSLLKTRHILKSKDIELELVTDQAILDLVRGKCNDLAVCYFNQAGVNEDWIREKSEETLKIIKERYNSQFNVVTTYSNELSLFVRDENAVKLLNNKKSDTLERIDNWHTYDPFEINFLRKLKGKVSSLADVTLDTLDDAGQWKKIVDDFMQMEYGEIQNKIDFLKKEISDASSSGKKAETGEINKWTKVQRLTELQNLAEGLMVSDWENNLLNGKVLAIRGKAGTGKSQLLAFETRKLLDAGRTVLTIAGGIYCSDDPIEKQILDNLRAHVSFEDLVEILNTIGEKSHHIVPIFIDALNETGNQQLWEKGLISIIDLINTQPFVKLAFTYRMEYENRLLASAVLDEIHEGTILRIDHNGFESNGLSAISEFLNYYHIQFVPLECFASEMMNPLFLSLYCKTYDESKSEVSLPELYDRLTEKITRHIKNSKSMPTLSELSDDCNIVELFLLELAAKFMDSHAKSINENDLYQLDFWGKYGIPSMVFVNQMVNENILIDFPAVNGGKNYAFAYDQMNDYFCAKVIINHYGEQEIRSHLIDRVLGIKNGELSNFADMGLFTYVCALYSQKYHEECIDVIDCLTSEDDKGNVFSEYLKSFEWRTGSNVSKDEVFQLVKRYPFRLPDLWHMLIANSVKPKNPLNADFLHFLLLPLQMNKRDSIWTLYINGSEFADTNERLMQIIDMYNHGKLILSNIPEQTKLILTLFGWFLTSSNRRLRDHVSKAMVEILKEHFEFCIALLQNFQDVNDSYVLQRLYGIVFGACCKAKPETDTYRYLAEYVYQTIFNKGKVYPDILLRDYARLIIERFMMDNSGYEGIIDINKIQPPYQSDTIPAISDEEIDFSKDIDSRPGLRRIFSSMRLENMSGLYGYFGRYVFQHKVHAFDVNLKDMYNYAIYYIVKKLGYKDEYFGNYDAQGFHWGINPLKIERIGKKYQWIAFYHIMALVSDHCKLCHFDDYPLDYDGPWDPYVRDFDPTINENFMKCEEVPTFPQIPKIIDAIEQAMYVVDISDKKSVQKWFQGISLFYDKFEDTLFLKDDSGDEWVCLGSSSHKSVAGMGNSELSDGKNSYAYFLSKDGGDFLMGNFNQIPLNEVQDLIWSDTVYSIFNREYPWAPSCKTLEEDISEDFHIKGVIKGNQLKFKYAEHHFLWETEWDASKEASISWRVPSMELINVLHLTQEKYDGYFYDSNKKLAAYDASLINKENDFLVLRKNLLDEFLSKTGLYLIWLTLFTKSTKAAMNDWFTLGIYRDGHFDKKIREIKEPN